MVETEAFEVTAAFVSSDKLRDLSELHSPHL